MQPWPRYRPPKKCGRTNDFSVLYNRYNPTIKITTMDCINEHHNMNVDSEEDILACHLIKLSIETRYKSIVTCIYYLACDNTSIFTFHHHMLIRTISVQAQKTNSLRTITLYKGWDSSDISNYSAIY